MSFLIRGAEETDLVQLMQLADQFTLLNMPANETVLIEKIRRSTKSFAGKAKKADAEFLFVVEDTDKKRLVGSSLILAKHGTTKVPHNYFKVLKREKFSEDLGIGFIHKVLKFSRETDGPTEVGGLLVDKSYRRRPEKLGKQVSLVRFLYMAMRPERFEPKILCELTPPLTDEGRSEFWEALGRRFTGLPYQEADYLSQHNKEFIKSLFPEEVYLTLLDARARFVVGRVGEQTIPAQHLLEGIGFKYLEEVDPFDGGPHFGAQMADIKTVKETKKLKVLSSEKSTFNKLALVGFERDGAFRGTQTISDVSDNGVVLPKATMDLLKLNVGDELYLAQTE
ncbi:MAG: arginine N-succinyltransferase [Bdellovibrionia bacterium]